MYAVLDDISLLITLEVQLSNGKVRLVIWYPQFVNKKYTYILPMKLFVIGKNEW